MVSPAIALAFLPLLLTLIIRYRYFFVLLYRAVFVRIWKDCVTGLSREERAFQYVLTHSTPGDPDSILDAFDVWCSKVEFISNIGPKKGGRDFIQDVLGWHNDMMIIKVCVWLLVWLGKILDRLLLEHCPLTVLELGSHCGYSTVRIARSLPLGARLYSIEMDQRNAAIAEKIIRLAGFDDDTVSQQQHVQSTIPTCRPSPSLWLFDLVYVDVMDLILRVVLFWDVLAMCVLQVELIVNPSDEVIPRLRSDYNLDRLDFVFMDHWKKCYLPDLQVTATYQWTVYSQVD